MVSFRVDRSILTDVLVAHGKHRGLGLPYTISGQTRLHGHLDVFDKQGGRWGGFMVTVLFPSDYPQVPPLLFEDQGRIKRQADWHVNNDRSLCLGPEVRELRKYMGRAHLLDWLDRSAMPFLANHLYKERTGVYLNGEFSHGVEGIWEYYLDEWDCSPGEVLRRLAILCGVKTPARQDPCYCGSQLPWRRCHLQPDMLNGQLRKAYAVDLGHLRRSRQAGAIRTKDGSAAENALPTHMPK